MKLKLVLQITTVLLLSGLTAQSALAIRVLGQNPFYHTYLADEADVKRVLVQEKADVEKGLIKAGSAELYEPLYAQLADAEISKVQYYKGQKFDWMFYRKKGKGKIYIDKDVVWESDDPMKSYEFFIDYNGQRYTFMIPPVCGNLTLLGAEPAPVIAPPVEEPAESAGQSGAGSPGTGTGPQTVAAPPVEAAERLPFVVDAGYLQLLDPGDLAFVRIGLEYPLTDNFSIIGMVGGAYKYGGRDGDNALIADVLANYSVSRFFIAAGLGGWISSGDDDLDSEDSDLDVILNVGARLFGEPESFNTSLFVEMRSAVDEMDDFKMYGRVGAGLRFRF